MEQLQPGNPVQLYAAGFEIRGPLDLEALRAALAAVVRRHEVLRMSLRERDGVPELHVASSATYPMAIFDIRATPDATRLERAMDICRAEAQRPYDLSAAPLARAVLVRVEDAVHVLAFCRHHLISDGGSTGILFREVSAIYAAALQPEANLDEVLPPLPVQYSDYSRWSREVAAGDGYTRQLQYWTGQLGDAPALLALPIDKPRPSVQRFASAYVERIFPDVTALRKVARNADATLFQTLMAAVHVLLYRSTDRPDVSIGFPVAGRPLPELNSLIGCFVNTVVLRMQPDPSETFANFLARVRETAAMAYANQDVPFDRIIEALHPERNLSYAPLVQVMATLLDPRRAALELTGAAVEPIELGIFGAPSDAFFEFKEFPDGLRCRLQYDTDLFEPASADAMIDTLVQLLAGISIDADRSLEVLPLMNERQRRVTLAGAEATMLVADSARPLHVMVAERATRTPDVRAVIDGNVTLTYRELDARANRVARRLQALGITREVPVGVYGERSSTVIVAMLGILKAGGAYVPLDPANPIDRLRYIIEDSRMQAILVSSAENRLGDCGMPVLSVEEILLESRDENEQLIEPDDADALANIIYTSGSTGTPKGVMVTHRGIVRLFPGTAGLDISAADVVAHLCSTAFDFATFEIWSALTCGARLVIVGADELLSPVQFGEKLKRCAITVVGMPTALFHEYAARHPGMFAALRSLIIGGEVLRPEAARAVLSAGAPGQLVNVYGPTETSTFATAFVIREILPSQASVPIGTPVSQTSVYLLDRAGNLVPPGIAGEICIGGPGVARGYLRRPDLTAERFVYDPFRPSGATMYRTGDRARYRNDGTIDFIGRVDSQIKLRGYRIELDEIEAVIRRHASVRDVVVLVNHDALVAYVVPVEGAGTDRILMDLDTLTRRWLPAYMVPAYALVPSLPLNANGKIDRAALSRNVVQKHDSRIRSDAKTGAQTMTESALILLWEEVLNVQDIGTTDDFFALGGHSLLAVRVVAEFHRRYGRTFPISALFANSTIESLARFIDDANGDDMSDIVVNSSGTRSPFFFLHGDLEGGGLYCRALAQGLDPEQPMYAFAPLGIDGSPVPSTIEAAATEYLLRIRSIAPTGPYRLGGYCQGGLIAFELARQLRAAGEGVDALILVDPGTAPDLAFVRPPLHLYARLRALSPEREQELLLRVRRALAFASELRAKPPRRAIRDIFEYARRAWRITRGGTAHESPGGEPTSDRIMHWHNLYARVYGMVAAFVPRRYAGPMTMIFATDRKPVIARRRGADPAAYWRARTGAKIERHMVRGDHYSIVVRQGHVVAEHVAAALQPANLAGGAAASKR
ncbi:MAG: hypothetical protein NVS2B17_12160 [Candidatus Velthaea sp.]